MDDEAQVERRREPRYERDLEVLVVGADFGPAECRILNINLYGCRLHVGELVPPDQFHIIDIESDKAVKAEVRWRQGELVGTRFSDGWYLSSAACPRWLVDIAHTRRIRQQAAARGLRIVASGGARVA